MHFLNIKFIIIIIFKLQLKKCNHQIYIKN